VDALLLDLDLPDINGLTLLNMLQKEARYTQLPVIIISAQDLPGALYSPKSGALQVRVNHPFAIVELQAILEGLLEKITTGYQRTETELDQPQGIESDQQSD
jgi:DNA-binding response OmpR family regulator